MVTAKLATRTEKFGTKKQLAEALTYDGRTDRDNFMSLVYKIDGAFFGNTQMTSPRYVMREISYVVQRKQTLVKETTPSMYCLK